MLFEKVGVSKIFNDFGSPCSYLSGLYPELVGYHVPKLKYVITITIHPNESMSREPPSPSFWGQALIFWFFLCCSTRRWIWEWKSHSQRGNQVICIQTSWQSTIVQYTSMRLVQRHISFTQFTYSSVWSVGIGQRIWRSTKLLFYCGANNAVAKKREDEQLEHTQVGRLFVCWTVFEIDWTTI